MSSNLRYVRSACSAASLLIALLAMSGCDQPPESGRDSNAESLGIDQGSSTKRAVGEASGVTSTEPKQSAVDAELQHSEVIELQSQFDALQIERDRLERQIRSHQAAGEQRLAALRAEWASMNQTGEGDVSPADRERFAERARVEMETTLMMDDEYRAQLQDLDERLEQLQQRVTAPQR